MFFGTAIEGLLQETENVGNEEKPRYEPKYKMKDLLDDGYRVPPKMPEVVDFKVLKKVQGILIEGL